MLQRNTCIITSNSSLLIKLTQYWINEFYTYRILKYVLLTIDKKKYNKIIKFRIIPFLLLLYLWLVKSTLFAAFHNGLCPEIDKTNIVGKFMLKGVLTIKLQSK